MLDLLKSSSSRRAFLLLLATAVLSAGQPADGATFPPGPIDIGDLPPGKTITIKFRADISATPSSSVVSNQGTVSGGNFPAVSTDDPDAGGTSDPTLTALDTLSVGNLLWHDVNRNGIFDSGAEPILAGVQVNLRDGGGSLITSTTSDGAGLYSFGGLLPGDYIVEIPASEFGFGEPLYAFISTSGSSDPDNDIDHDDNGVDSADPATFGISSLAVTLFSDTEPCNQVSCASDDGDPDPDTNLTVDFGFVRSVDLAVSKTESVDPVVAGSGPGNLTYVVTVTNNGPADASGVVLSEGLILPVGATVDSITPSAGSFADPFWTVGNLASGASATLTIQLTVDASTASGTDVISVTATVTAVNEIDGNAANDSVTESTSVVRQVDLAVSKSESIDPVVAGSGAGNLTYVVTVTNLGPGDASGVVLSESLTLPSGVVIHSITPSVGSFAESLWTVGDLASGANATLTVQLTVDPTTAEGTDVISNTAAVSAVNEGDSNSANDSVTESTSVVRQVDLAVVKSESVDPVIAGSGAGNLTYIVTVTNNGPANASGVVVTESLTLPSGVKVDSITPSVGSFVDSLWTVGDLALGASATLTVQLTVDPTTAEGTDVIGDTAAVSAVNETDINGANDSATESTSVMREVDLAVAKSESIDPVLAGSGPGNLTYTATVTNSGPSDASGVVLTETLTLPSGVSIDSVTPSVGSFADSLWTVGDLALGASATLTVQLTVDSSTVPGPDVISNTAEVSAVNEADSNAVNNSATESTSVTREVDLAVSKSESIDPAIAGSGPGNLTYVVTVTNNGPADATGVALTESLILPLGVTVHSITPSVGSFADPVWTVGTVASGASATLTVQLTVDSTTAQGTDVVSNTAEVSAVTETDTNPTNDSATESTSVVRQVDLVVTKTESVDPVIAGSGPGNLTYMATVTNNGPGDATGVVLIETLKLPSGVTVDSIIPSVGTFADPVWTVGDLASGASATLTIQLTVDASTVQGPDVISDIATVTAVSETELDVTNNSATEATSVEQRVDLAVSKTESADPVLAGSGPGNLTYVVTVTNNGPSHATGVVLTETLDLPSGVSVDSITPSVGTFVDSLWTVGDLSLGASATLTVQLTVGSSAPQGPDVISNTAEVTAVDGTEIEAANSSATESTSVTREVDLAVSKTESVDPVIVGSGAGNLTYVATVTNHGPSDASGVALIETLTLPLGVSVDSIIPSAGSFADPVWTVGTLASGASATLTVQLTVDASSSATPPRSPRSTRPTATPATTRRPSRPRRCERWIWRSRRPSRSIR
jgi:uncharacterized repeat protein (TIGR01451 family)